MINEENKGKRVKLINIEDPYTELKPGDEGTYELPSRIQVSHSTALSGTKEPI